MSETDPIVLYPRAGQREALRGGARRLELSAPQNQDFSTTSFQAMFDRQELNLILSLYGRFVAAGEWRDYAIDCHKDRAVFSVFRRSSEMPLYRIEKCPKLARRQGMYKVVAMSGLILKRGHDLRGVLQVLEPKKAGGALSV